MSYDPRAMSDLDAEQLLIETESAFSLILKHLELVQPERRIAIYLYRDAREKAQLSCHPGEGHALHGISEIHVIRGESTVPTLLHESTHVAWEQQVGESPSIFINEGVAVLATYVSSKTPIAMGLADKAVDSQAELVSWVTGTTEFWEAPRTSTGDFITYPLSGAFAAFLVERAGLAKYKSLFTADDVTARLQKVYGIPADKLVADFAASLTDSTATSNRTD